MSPLAVVALGGNALLRRGEPAEASHQQANVRDAAQAIAALHATHRLVITHGNGPQVGLLALQAEAYPDVRPYPLDVLGAETEGMIGYLLDQALLNELPPGSRVATLLTQTVVDPADPAFAVPSKPIGPVYEPEVGERLARERGWNVRPDGPHVRRVVASPQPIDIVEIETIRLLLDAGVLVVCAGGGGIPVVAKPGAGLVSRPSSTRTCPRPCSPRSSRPTSCSCSRMSPRWRSAGGRPKRAPFAARHLRSYAAWTSPQARWARRSRRRAASPS